MHRTWRGLGVGVLVVTLMSMGGTAATAASNEAPKGTEIGVSPTAVHIAVMADVDNQFAPGLFKGVVDGVKGAATYLNTKAGGGGVGGRKILVDFIDSHLDANAARNGVITACGKDLALVGTTALFLTTVDDEVNCRDQAGATTGLPDLAGVATGVPESCSPVAFPVNAVQLVCSTKDQHPQTYHGNQGDTKYLLSKHKNDLHGALIASNDTPDANRGGEVLLDTVQKAGIKADQDVTRGGRDQQTAYTSIIQQMKTDNSNYSLMVLAANSAIELRSEAQIQGLTDPNIVWECTTACYDNSLKQNASVMEGEYVPVSYLPFEEAGENKMLDTFLEYVGKNNADGFSVYGWEAGIAFAQAARAAVAKNGVNGLTRKTLLDGIKTLTHFDAGGMVAAVNIPDKVPSACFALLQFRSGKFVRVYPAKKGTFDCKPSNEIEVKADLIKT